MFDPPKAMSGYGGPQVGVRWMMIERLAKEIVAEVIGQGHMVVVYRDAVCGGVSLSYRCKEAKTEAEAREEFLRRSQGYKGWEIVEIKGVAE